MDVTNYHDCDTSKADCSRCPLGPNGFIFRRQEIDETTGKPVDTQHSSKAMAQNKLDWNPVPPEIKNDDQRDTSVPRIAYITSAPSLDDVEAGRPLSDRDVVELHTALSAAGISRAEIDIFPDVACSSHLRQEEIELRVRAAQQIMYQVCKKKQLKDKDAKLLAQIAYPHPIDCCRPKLLADTEDYDNFIVGGSTPYRAITNERKSVIEIAGDPETKEVNFPSGVKKIKILPTYHPRFVKKSPGYREEYTNHIAKALRLFSPAGLNWPPFGQTLIETPEQFEEWLSAYAYRAPFITVDIESSKDDCLYAIMDMFQIGVPDLTYDLKLTEDSTKITYYAEAMAIRFISVETGLRVHSTEVEAQFIAIIKRILEDPNIVKVGHNIIAYDREVLLAQHNILMCSVIDSIFLARAIWPDQRKGLKPVGRRVTDVGRWENKDKGEKALDAGNDQIRFTYGLTDVIVNARIMPAMLRRAEKNGYFNPIDPKLRPSYYDSVCTIYNPSPKVNGTWAFNLLNIDQTRQAFCSREMHATGIYIDQAQVQSLVTKYQRHVAKIKKRLAANLKLAGITNIDSIIHDAIDRDDADTDEDVAGAIDEALEQVNEEIADTISDEEVEVARKTVSSSSKFRDLLYKDWDLPVPPNTPADFGLTEDEFKTATGLNGTGNAVLLAYLGCKGLLTDLQRKIINDKRIIARIETKILGTTLLPMLRNPPGKRKSLVHYDGRVRSSIRAFTTAPGRYASSAPNLQNFGNKKGQELLPSIFSCPEGRMLIGFDVDQFHIRIMANFWGIKRYLAGFVQGLDPHVGMAEIMVGAARMRDADGWGPDGYNPKKKPKYGEAKGLRDTAKGVGYTYAYLCILAEQQILHAAKKMLSTLKATEVASQNKEGAAVIDHVCGRKKGDPITCDCSIPKLNLPYIDMAQMTVEQWLRNIFEKEKDWQAAWNKLLELYKQNKLLNNGVGFMESYYFKRRSGNLSDGKAQEVVNFPILSTEQDAMALMEFAVVNLMMTLWRHLNPKYILQVHDACKLEIDDPAGYGAPRCDPGHDAKSDVKCIHCEARRLRVKELKNAVIMQFGDDPVAYTTEGHWGWTLADI